ncbi:hypothetical protein HFP51_14545 [Parasphingopyxis sp. CP4]|uniref:hypothetical protein n=1 Tax=Parasphingopyxis sp. CP4 TaxID=2724527 RepID=UPI0015A1E8F3|nr:hypothetical protein [Parasphingopyxis sp. CP4]QLC23304.1 hypothetical protein HFP51_14545 [Parasphingopyxis sp. CP4]
MNDKTAHPMGPNVRRFVRSAWLLLMAQLLAAVLALSATGWAAFYVADLRAERDMLRAQVEEFVGGDVDPDIAAPVVEPIDDPVEMVDEPSSPPPAPSEPEPEATTAPAVPVVREPRPAPVATPTPRPAAPTPRTPAPQQPVVEEPAPREAVTEEPTARRPNRTYPGGLPGDHSANAEPPYVPGRYVPERPTNRVPSIPDIDLDGLVPPAGHDDPVQRSPNDNRLGRDDRVAIIQSRG